MQTLEKTLWGLVKSHLPVGCDSQRIETGSTGRGIPDVNLCWMGRDIWVELKIVMGSRVSLRPEQVAWAYRRTKAGGTVWILARDKFDGVRKGKGDRIFIWPGSCAADVLENGIKAEGCYIFDAPFDWDSVMAVLWPEAQKTPLSANREGGAG